MNKPLPILISILLIMIIISGCTKKEETTKESPSAEVETFAGYPEKSIQWIVPYPAGGGTDSSSRIFKIHLDKALGRNSVMTNMVGSAGTVGTLELINSDPDGYTILATYPGGIMIPHIMGTFDYGYDDMEVICQFSTQVWGLVVKADSPYNTLEDLLDAARSTPGSIKLGGGFNSIQQIALLELKEKSGASFDVVEIGGTAIKAPELLSGRVDAYIDAPSAFSAYIESGEFRCIAVFSEERDTQFFPDVPTCKESGYDVVYDISIGLVAPKGTPVEIVNKISAAAKIAAESEDCINGQSKLFTRSDYLDTTEFSEKLEREYAILKETMTNLM